MSLFDTCREVWGGVREELVFGGVREEAMLKQVVRLAETSKAAARATRLLKRTSLRRPVSIWAIADQLTPE